MQIKECKKVIQILPTPVLLHDSQNSIYFNKAFQKFTEKEAENKIDIAFPLSELFTPSTHLAFIKSLECLSEHEHPIPHYTSLLIKGNQIKQTVLLSLKVHLQEHDAYLTIFDNLLEKDNELSSLRTSEALYKQIFNSALVGLARSRISDGKILEANDHIAQILGYSDSQEFVKSQGILPHYVNIQDRNAFIQELMDKGCTHQYEIPFKRKDGKKIWGLSSAFILKDFECIEGFLLDITHQKETEIALQEANSILENRVKERTQKLQESEEKYRQIVETAQEGICILNLNFEIVFTNQVLVSMLGFKHIKEVIGLNIFEFIPLQKHSQVKDSYKQQLNGKKTLLQFELLRPESSTLWVEMSTSFIRDNEKKIIRGIAMLRDISEQKQLQKDLLSFSEVGYRYFSHNIHSEVGQLSTAINLKLETLKIKSQQDKQEIEDIQLIANTLQNQIRNISQLFSEPAQNHQIQSSLRDLCKRAHQLFNINCSIDCTNFLMNLTPYQNLQIYRIVQEAILNAVKHGQATMIQLVLASKNNKFTLTIQDNGTGFETNSKPNGLGIKMMNYRASELKASLSIKSTLSNGSIITLHQL